MTTNTRATFLIVDDDEHFCRVMQRALARRHLIADTAHSADAAIVLMEQEAYEHAIIDLKIAQDSGLRVIKSLKTINPAVRMVMLTGYSSVTTAVEAIKLGAVNYLSKPAEVDAILKALADEEASTETSTPIVPPSLDRMEWEHIQQSLQDNHGNISATARALNMHRRTLQRKLMKRPANQ